jgi:hypothetical protein
VALTFQFLYVPGTFLSYYLIEKRGEEGRAFLTPQF